MADMALTCIGSKYKYSDKEKALKAALAISKIYNHSIQLLSDNAIEMFKINVNIKDEKFENDVLSPPDLIEAERDYLNKEKQRIESRLSQLLPQLSNKNKIL